MYNIRVLSTLLRNIQVTNLSNSTPYVETVRKKSASSLCDHFLWYSSILCRSRSRTAWSNFSLRSSLWKRHIIRNTKKVQNNSEQTRVTFYKNRFYTAFNNCKHEVHGLNQFTHVLWLKDFNIIKASTVGSSTHARHFTSSPIYALCNTTQYLHDLLPCNQHTMFWKMLYPFTTASAVIHQCLQTACGHSLQIPEYQNYFNFQQLCPLLKLHSTLIN